MQDYARVQQFYEHSLRQALAGQKRKIVYTRKKPFPLKLLMHCKGHGLQADHFHGIPTTIPNFHSICQK